MLKLPEIKTCGCGVTHDSVPHWARYDEEFEVYYWECNCRSTLMYTPDKERTFALIRGQFEKGRTANAQANKADPVIPPVDGRTPID